MFGRRSGRGVIMTAANQLFHSPDTLSATAFLLVPCLAMDTAFVSEEDRPRCVSLADPDRANYYVGVINNILYARADDSSALFKRQSSFILHADAFYGGYYAFQNVLYNCYIYFNIIVPLRLVTESYVIIFRQATSFKLYEYDTSRKYHCYFREVTNDKQVVENNCNLAADRFDCRTDRRQ